MTVAAIVVTYNSEREVRECLRALSAAEVAIIVVDNASADESCRIVRDEFPEAVLVANEENLGFALAVNQALTHVDANTVLLVNPDCVVPPTTVRALAEYLGSHPRTGIVAPRVFDANGVAANTAHPFENALTVLAGRFGGTLLPIRLRRVLSRSGRRHAYDVCRAGNAAATVDWVSGSCLAVRASLLRRLGGLDTGYFLYFEDEELCLQVWRAGLEVVYLPRVGARHSGGASSRDEAEVRPHVFRSLLRFQARHRPRTYPLVRIAAGLGALLGVTLGVAGDAVALARRRPARRAVAWARVVRVVMNARTPREGRA